MVAEPTLGFVEANGIRQAVHDWGGRGMPVVLVHGTRFLGRLWDPIARVLLPEYRPIAVDRRGHGDSEKALDGYRREDGADDLVAVIQGLGLERPFVVAHSVGAITTLIAAAGCPGAIGPAVLMEPGLPPREGSSEGPPAEQLAALNQRATRRRSVWTSREAVVEAYRTRPPFASWLPEVFDLYVQHAVADLPDGQVELKFGGEVEIKYYEQGLLTDPWPYLPKVESPVLLVRGTASNLFKQPMAEEIAALLPNCRLVLVDGATHSLPMEQPELVARMARNFFNEQHIR